MDLISLVVRRRLLVHFFVIIAAVVGIYHYMDMPRNFFPNANLDQAFVVVPWPGASAAEVEQEIVNKLEESLSDLEGVDELISNSEESSGTVGIYIEQGIDNDKFMLDLQTAINAIPDLPEDSEDPIFFELTSSMVQPVCFVSMGGDVADNVLFEVAEDLKRELEDINGVSKIDMNGFLDLEVHVMVDADLMDHYGVSLGEIMAALAAQNLDMPGGQAEMGDNSYKLRVLGKYRDMEDIGSTVLRAGPAGAKLRLRDLAEIKREVEDRFVYSRLDGNPAGNLIVYKDDDSNTLDISAEVREIVAHYNASLPVAVVSEVRLDSAELIEERLGIMTNNAWLTAIIVGLLLLFFIGWVNSLLVLVGIPFTFLVGFFLMSMTGMSVNMLTLFALIMALGLVVDDAIVVVDNVQRYIERGVSPTRAAIVGTKEVLSPVISAVATTIAGFTPLLFMTGMMGKFISAIPKAVIFALLASLVEALIVLPAHTAEVAQFNVWFRKKLGMKAKHVQREFTDKDLSGTKPVKRNPVYLLLRKGYRKQLGRTLRYRYVAVGSVILLAILSIAAVRMLPVRMFPDEDFDQIIVQYDLPPGTSLEITDKVTQQVERLVNSVPEDEVKAVVAISGYQIKNYQFLPGSHLGEVNIDLVSAADRTRSDREIMDELRKEIAGVPGIVELNLSRPQGGPPSGKPVEIRILGPRLEVLEELGEKLKTELASIHGVVDIRDDFTRDGREYLINVNRDRASEMGISSRDIGMTVGAAFLGFEATQFTEADGRERPVIVRLKESQRDRLDTLGQLKVSSMSGGLVPLSNLVDFEHKTNLRVIRHSERERAITITAELSEGQNSTVVNQTIMERFATFSTDHPGYRLFFGGEFERTAESFKSLFLMIPIAFLIIFMILAGQFNSLSQPLAVIFTVPLSFIGVVIGLLVMGYELTIPAMVGIIALMGLVVNNSLLMVDFINKSRRSGRGRWTSIVRSGVVRLRPILLTTVTTITGLSTLTVASTGATKIMVPMAVSMIWGLAFATVLTLFLIPSLIAVIDDIKIKLGMSMEDAEEI
ncbi:efflux RND transporter permease subunit [bacterium]|nr:efflux RND transporter permease subunit [bacterium]